MKRKVCIPGYFDNCIIKDHAIKEDKFAGKTLYVIKGNQIKEPGIFGKTVLVIEKNYIKLPGFFGSKIFKLDNNGDVKENKFFGKTVGYFPYYELFEPKTQSISKPEYREEPRKEETKPPVGPTNVSVKISVGSEKPTKEQIMGKYNEVYAYYMFLEKYQMLLEPKKISEDGFAHFQFLRCGVDKVYDLYKTLCEKGYYSEATLEDNLAFYNVGGLKDILTKLELDTKGKRDTLVDRIVSNVSIEQFKSVVEEIYYKRTELADKYLVEHADEYRYYCSGRDKFITLEQFLKEEKEENDKFENSFGIDAIKMHNGSIEWGNYLTAAQRFESEGKKSESLINYLEALRIEISGVNRYKVWKELGLKDVDFRLESATSLSTIYFNQNTIQWIKKLSDFYNDEMLGYVTSLELPINACNDDLFKEIVQSILDDSFESFKEKFYDVLRNNMKEIAINFEKYV